MEMVFHELKKGSNFGLTECPVGKDWFTYKCQNNAFPSPKTLDSLSQPNHPIVLRKSQILPCLFVAEVARNCFKVKRDLPTSQILVMPLDVTKQASSALIMPI